MTAFAVFRVLWAFLRSPLGKVLAGVLCLLAVLWLADARGYRRGVDTVDALWAKRLADSTAKARQTEAKNDAATVKTEARVEAAQTIIRTRTEYLTREVPIYVPLDPGRPSLAVGAVRLLDAAALGLPPAPDRAGRPDDAPSGVDDRRLVSTVIGNYGVCHDSAERLKAWQSWAIETGLVK